MRKYDIKLGWPITILLFVIPTVIWAWMYPFGDRFETPQISLLSISRLTGVAAIVLFCLNMILSTRIKIMESMFGGLNKMFIAHHIVGGLALCFALVHPITFSLHLYTDSLYESARALIPGLNDWQTTVGIIGLWGFILLMVFTFYIKLPYRVWLFTHKFLGAVFILIALHVVFITSDANNSTALRYYLLALIFLAIVSFIYRTLLPRFFVRRYPYIIDSAQTIAPGVTKIVMAPKSRGIDFKSGQFIFVSFRTKGISGEWHPFTISSNSAEKGLTIIVKNLGKYTATLTKIAPNLAGSDVWIEGAYGKFSFRHFKSNKQIWVAGGIGVTPFLSMISEVSGAYHVDFYYSVKNDQEMIDTDRIKKAVVGKSENLRFIPVVTDRDGFLNVDKIIATSGDISDSEILLCGPPPMMKAIRAQLKQKGINSGKIHSEEFAMT